MMTAIPQNVWKRLGRAMRGKALLPALIIATAWLEAHTLLAQERAIAFKHLTIDDGLSQSSVLCILQDRKGFLWFGTQDGLNKYDGYRFTVYRHEASDSTSLSENYVESIYEDRSGTLWIGTIGGGLNRFNRDTETFTAFFHDPKDPHSLSHNAILSLYEDSSGRLWIGTQGGGLNEMDRSTGRFTRYLHDPNNPGNLSNNQVWQIREDAGAPNILWLGTEVGLTRFNRDTGAFTRFVHDSNNPHTLSHNLIRAMHIDRAGTLWVGTWGGLNRFDRSTEQFTRFVHNASDPHSLGDNRIWAICEDPATSGVLWIATYGGGLNRFDSRPTPRDRGRFTRFLHNPVQASSLSDNNVKSIYTDRSGTLWIGTWNGGVNMVGSGRKQFNHFSRLDGLSHNTAQGFAVDPVASHLVWIGTWGGGLNRFNRKTGQFKHFVHDPQNPRSLSHDRVRSVLIDHAGVLWVGTDHGLNRFDRNAEEFVRFNYAPRARESHGYNTINAICEDAVSPGTLWLGTNGDGLIRHVISGGEGADPGQEAVTHFDYNPENPNGLGSGRVSSLCVDHSGTLWVGTDRGLHRFDRATGRFVRFVHDPANPNSLSHNGVLSIHESTDPQGTTTLWIGTAGGLNKLALSKGEGSNRDTQQFTHYTEQDGLPNAVIHGILEDGHGRLWLSTNKGLSRLDPSANPPAFRNYDVTDGLQSNEFGEGTGHKSSSGEMFFGGINGFNLFHPDSIKDNPYVPSVVITDFQIFNQSPKIGGKDSPLRQHISETDEIVLSYQQSVFSFEFAALDYTAPGKNRHAYKMEGFDQHWNEVGARRFATYTNLDPGDYVFRVRGSNNDGVWNETGAAIKITITPPPWKTWWAYMLYVFLGTAFLYGLRRYELNRIRLKDQVTMKQLEAEKLKELDTLKSRFFANLSHEFRTPLTLILGPVEQILSEVLDEKVRMKLRLVHANGQRLLALINQLLDLSKLESGKMQLRAAPGNPVEFLQRLTVAFAPLAERKQITLRFEAKARALELYFDRDKMEKIFSNLLSNAIKFTPEGGSVIVECGLGNAERVSAIRNPKSAIINVRDTGIGIPAEKLPHIFDRFYQANTSSTREFEGTGIGLALVKELVELHHGKISVASAEVKGATFTVRLPLGKDHLAPEEILEVSEQYSSVTGEQSSVVSDQYSVMREGEEREAKSEGRIATSGEQSDLVLLVEDHAELRRYLRQELEPAYRVLEAADGEAGWQMAVETIPDLVICDVMMPKMNGYEFCSRLKTDEHTSHVPVILLTAKAGTDDKVAGLETGADDYLSKPFAAKELLARVKNLIAQRRKLRQRFAGTVALKPSEIAVTSIDEKFLRRLLEIVEAHLDEEDFGVVAMSREAGMSQPQLWRKIKALTGQSPNQFIRAIRLQRAKQLLEAKTGNIAEVAYAVGFSNLSYFAKCFREQFGQPPSVYKDLGGKA
ncbi:hybrid sensor histidine kinase/response regulator [candidate division KSB1 bacterium]|nr:hybrid sensor histidine kinase/response regulator [candidate division KSB1 bacterium]